MVEFADASDIPEIITISSTKNDMKRAERAVMKSPLLRKNRTWSSRNISRTTENEAFGDKKQVQNLSLSMTVIRPCATNRPRRGFRRSGKIAVVADLVATAKAVACLI